MKVLRFELKESQEGLQPISMDRLGDVVLLAGRNGSGKSRILRALSAFLGSHFSAEEMENLEREHRQNVITRDAIKELLKNAEAGQPSLSRDDEIASRRRQLSQVEATLKALDERFQRHHSILLDTEGTKPVPVLYHVKETDLIDHRNLRQSEIDSAAKSISSEFNVALARQYGLPALRDFVNEYVYAQDDERAILEPKMLRLKTLIRNFLGAELTWDSKSPKLFDMPVGEAQLSEGQKVLLQIALSVFFQDGTRDGLVLLLDEPENHLHPQALLDVVSRIRSACPNAQVWIATHSVHLLAHFDSSGIWFVDGGGVEFSGDNASRVLDSLIGGEDGAEELADFLALPTKVAISNFAAECLLSPGVVDTGLADPQTTQIAKLLSNRRSTGRPLRILDFGIGKGRLLASLLHQCDVLGIEFRQAFDYVGFDLAPSEGDEALCRSRIGEIYGDDQGRYLKGEGALSALNDASVDVIVMCNVLHEVPLADWLRIFGGDGSLTRIASESGVLLVVEDQVLRVGERAHDFGYLVLDGLELKLFFGGERESSSVRTHDHPDDRYKGRLKAHEIDASMLKLANTDTRKLCLKQLVTSADAALTEIQGRPVSKKAAKAYAFWAHQHVNASRALTTL